MKAFSIGLLFFCGVAMAANKAAVNSGAGKPADKAATATPAAGGPGQKLFATNCSSCHGPDGMAQTDLGKAVKARNLVSDPFKQVKDKAKGVTEEDVMGTLKTGVPGTSMAPFAHLPESDRKELAKYVVSLRASAKK